ncbi:hypothetical protein R3P38DRAFT_2952852 [Favolaschia claudopus]|uniref:F-box domain-containing protein n=1 Tax=Favolaschia claudopus TaxID=2862362 RepID=A0AAW0BFS0_9AGAR
MHHALQIPEIAELILANFDPLVDGKELAVVARTCTLLHEIALDALWRHQDTIYNLIRCMPSDLWKTVKVGTMDPSMWPTRSIIDSDWERALKYSHRVRKFTCRGHRLDGRIPDMLFVFQSLRFGVPSGFLLPNLLELVWDQDPSNHISFIRLFLSPGITAMHILRCPSESDVFPLLRDYPALTQLTLGSREEFAGNDANYEARSNLICSLAHLQRLDVGIVNSEALVSLGQRSTLQQLRVVLADSVSFPESHKRTLFSTLRAIDLRLQGRALSPLLYFLRILNSPKLRSFKASVAFELKSNQAEDLYTTISLHSSYAFLETLRISVTCSPTNALHDEHIQLGHSLGHLFSFTQLQVVVIQSPGGFDLDDTTIRALARSWPCLVELRLLAIKCLRPPRASIAVLEAFAKHCPNLRLLEITLNAFVVPPTSEGHEPVHRGRVTWSVDRSAISDARQVADFLSSTFCQSTVAVDSYNFNPSRKLWSQVALFLF